MRELPWVPPPCKSAKGRLPKKPRRYERKTSTSTDNWLSSADESVQSSNNWGNSLYSTRSCDDKRCANESSANICSLQHLFSEAHREIKRLRRALLFYKSEHSRLTNELANYKNVPLQEDVETNGSMSDMENTKQRRGYSNNLEVEHHATKSTSFKQAVSVNIVPKNISEDVSVHKTAKKTDIGVQTSFREPVVTEMKYSVDSGTQTTGEVVTKNGDVQARLEEQLRISAELRAALKQYANQEKSERKSQSRASEQSKIDSSAAADSAHTEIAVVDYQFPVILAQLQEFEEKVSSLSRQLQHQRLVNVALRYYFRLVKAVYHNVVDTD